MADKPEVLATPEEKLAQAKELFGRGSRNYFTKQYSEAADDLSACLSLYSEVKGQLAEELGTPYLMYAKALVALGTEENKLLAPEDDEEEEDEGDDEGEDDGTEGGNEAEAEGEANDEDAKSEESEAKEEEEAKSVENGEKSAATNGHTEEEEEKPSSSEDGVEPQSGPSTSTGVGAEKEDIEAEDDKGGSNLEVAWEVLELAVKIFEEQGEKAYDSLSEALSRLADISFENSHFEVAVTDFNKALAVYAKMAEPNKRAIAEIHYKIGLAHLMLNSYEDSVMSLKKAANIMDEEIEVEKKKEQTDEIKANIKDLEETKQEILVKITEVEEAKTTSIEQIKDELAKIIGNPAEGESSKQEATPSNGSGTTASPPSAEKKATDITHLIKRKKPDTQSAEVEGSPAKKTHIEGEKNGTSS